MLVIKTHVYKLDPTKVQKKMFENWVGTCRFVHNSALEYRKYMYSKGINILKFEMMKELPLVKKTEGLEWIADVLATTLQAVIERLYDAYERFFELGAGFPKFANKYSYKSFVIKNNTALTAVTINKNRIKVPKIGSIKFFNSRNIEGKIKRAIINKKADGWYVSIIFEKNIEPLPKVENNIGIDLGIKNFAVTSDGEYIENPKYYNKYKKQLIQLRKSLDRKENGSNGRKIIEKKLAKLHQKISNCRRDFLNKLSTKFINENQVIVVEALGITRLIKNSNTKSDKSEKGYLPKKAKYILKKSIGDAGWGMFNEMLDYKAKWYERSFIKVSPKYTSKDCSNCGYRNEEITLKVRKWICPKCNASHNRDENAAKNILNKWSSGRTLEG